MRLGLDLRFLPADEVVDRAREADRLGVWAVLLDSPIVAAELATQTHHVHIAWQVDDDAAHPLTIAEEVAILDHLSARRMMVIIDDDRHEQVRQLAHGHIVESVALAPPPAQTALPVWTAAEAEHVELSGDLDADRTTIDQLRDGGTTHAFASWPAGIDVFARHLVTRALTPDFPQIVADHADVIAPLT